MTAGVTVLTGPSGVGKGTVVAELIRQHPEVWLSISATTRSPRPGEVNGVTYWFVDDAEFDRLIETGSLLEWAVVHRTARYGTPRTPVEAARAAGLCCLLELDLAGARQVKHALPDCRTIFLLPPSWAELERRLRGRGTENSDALARRLRTAEVELAAVTEFDASVVNSDVAQTVADLVELLGLGPGTTGPIPHIPNEGTQ